MKPLNAEDFIIPKIGECKIENPLKKAYSNKEQSGFFVDDRESIYFNIYHTEGKKSSQPTFLLEKAGPREKIFFAPSQTHAAIITCGGLCPGLNNVIRALVRTLWFNYGVKRITGIPYGYQGLLSDSNLVPVSLTPNSVDDIHKEGGTILGSSRGGGERTQEIVDSLQRMNINMLFTIGGDGTQKGALAIAEEAERRNYTLSVVGVPKTVDNDLGFVQQSFGFATAVEEAVKSVVGAHAEAKSAFNGIGIVKVMGRHSGFIAAHTALSSTDVNFCLIPEVPFDLEGEKGFLQALTKRVVGKKHAVIMIAEGAAQDLIEQHKPKGHDASGNIILEDAGIFLKNKIEEHLKSKKIPVTVKYIDPSYMVRSMPANSYDSLYTSRLGANAVHAAMTGRTKVLMSLWSNKYVHVPISLATRERNTLKVNGSFWRDVLAMTQQPLSMKN